MKFLFVFIIFFIYFTRNGIYSDENNEWVKIIDDKLPLSNVMSNQQNIHRVTLRKHRIMPKDILTFLKFTDYLKL